MQQVCADVHWAHMQRPVAQTQRGPPSFAEPPSMAPPELLPEPLLLPDVPLDEPVDPLEEPLLTPPLLEPELPTLAHWLAQFFVEQAISLSPAPRVAAEQLHAEMHSASAPPRSRHPT